MITRMDRGIGRILELLRDYGLDENTLVVFTSDNGPTYGGIGGSDTRYFKSNHPFSGLKGSVGEGGIRVPMIARWPGTIEPGTVSAHMAAFQDVLPTLADVAGMPAPEETDGISFLPALKGEQQEAHAYLYWEFPAYGGQVAVRMGKWKAIRKGLFKDPHAPLKLYDLANDTTESNDVAERYPDIVSDMEHIIREARTPSQEFPFPALDSLQVGHGVDQKEAPPRQQ
jgi:arylsulfatase